MPIKGPWTAATHRRGSHLLVQNLTLAAQPDGKLERYVEGVLPVVASHMTFGSIDERSLREEGGAVWFDRIEVKLETRGGDIKRTVAARETFKVQVPPT